MIDLMWAHTNNFTHWIIAILLIKINVSKEIQVLLHHVQMEEKEMSQDFLAELMQ